MKILIADDNKNMRDMIRSIIQHIDHTIDECENGGEAISMVTNIGYDIVLMDIKMHPVNGLAATKIITTNFPGTKVIIISAYSTDQHKAKAEDAGAVGFVSKDNLSVLMGILSNA